MGVDDSYTKYLFHFDGADGGTVITDEGGHSMTAYSSTTETDDPKFGTAALDVAAYAGGVATADSEDTDFGTAPFSIDIWSRGATGDPGAWDKYCGSGTQADGSYQMWFCGRAGGKDTMMFSWKIDAGYAENFVTGLSWDGDEVWYHAAFCRSGTNLYHFWKGTLVLTWDIGVNTAINGGSTGLVVAARYNLGARIEGWETGYLDELRISKGIARWTSNFTPPTAPYPAGDFHRMQQTKNKGWW